MARVERAHQRAARKAARRDKRRAAAAQSRWSTVDQGSMMVVEEELDDDFIVDPVYDADDRNWVRYRPFWGGFMRLVVLGVVVAAAVLWVRGRVYGWVDAQITPEGLPGDAVELTIPQGASVNEIAGELQSAGVISNATVFRYWLRCDGDLTISGFLGCGTVVAVEAGDYILYENMDFESVRTVFDAGPLPEVFEIVRIPEGLRWSEMAVRLTEENPAFDRDELEAAYVSLVPEASYLPDDAPVRSLEGMLFPATYDVSADDLGDEHGFLLRLSDEFDRRFARLLQEPGLHPDIVELGLAPYDVAIVASLIEEEAQVSEDRAKIARVVYNRLAEGWRLDIDATACYAAAKSCADLTSADIRRESPWNTRAVTGLPPTPISAPGEASLEAALQPADGDWMFYVRTDEGGVRGAHRFAATYEEHLENVQVCRELGYC
ncbi:MAG: endolytic transglycosylase MltG [Acidimicrobiaceae bacterium]|nr:endolytic transglycosylase MltG [Acidimicrobiaceae bacterium]